MYYASVMYSSLLFELVFVCLLKMTAFTKRFNSNVDLSVKDCLY